MFGNRKMTDDGFRSPSKNQSETSKEMLVRQSLYMGHKSVGEGNKED